MTCNSTSFDLFEEPSGKDLVHFLNDSETRQNCTQQCDSFPTAKSFFYNSHTKECKCLSRSFISNGEHIEKLGAPKGCSTVLDKCVRMTKSKSFFPCQ